jgi:hypothetical protein
MDHVYKQLPHIAWRGQYSTGMRASPLGETPVVVFDEYTDAYLETKRKSRERPRLRAVASLPVDSSL